MNKQVIGLIIAVVLVVAGFIINKYKSPAQSDVKSAQTEKQKNTQTKDQAASTQEGFSKSAKDNNPNEGGVQMQFSKPPAIEIDMDKKYSAVLKTEVGEIAIDLNAKETPATVNNFVFLAKKGFYKNVIFHRVIKGFMIQTGDPTGTGAGGPGYRFNDEVFEGSYTQGTVAMANAGPNTNGSQFFIMHGDMQLPKNYVIFGHVSKGLAVVDKIATAPVETSASGENSKPVKPVKILSVEISEK